MMSRALAIILLLAAQALTGFAQDADLIRENYSKEVCRIPMRDGCLLYTAVYIPKDTSCTYPFLMMRTPYGVQPYGTDEYPWRLGPSQEFVRSGFIFVDQDVRGQFMSDGTFVNMTPYLPVKSSSRDVDESTDTYDTIEWLLHHIPHNNGKAGMWGVSYPGFYVSEGSINAHPALKAVSPQAPIADWFIGDDVHHNGAFFLLDNFRFSSGFDRIHQHPTTTAPRGYEFHTPDAYTFFLEAGPTSGLNKRYCDGEMPFWDSMMVHNTYDSYWTSRNLLPHLSHMPPAVLVVGGWFDAEDLYGTLHSYASIEALNPQCSVSFAMGPWAHGAWAWSDGGHLGSVAFGQKTAVFFRDSIEFPFFVHFLKDSTVPFTPNRWMFETGSNVWRTYDSWPPHNSELRTAYLEGSNQLTFTPLSGGPAYDEFISDPSKPVPYDPAIRNRRVAEFMLEDQRFAACRPDVLVYETPPFEHAMTIVGPIEVHLSASTSGTDCDWVVKVIDVFPDSVANADSRSDEVPLAGYQMLLRGDVMPSRFRKGFVHQVPMVPGEPTEIKFTMQDINHCFLPGHHLMVQVQSSWFPLVERNPQQFVSVHDADAGDMKTATQRIYHDATHRSSISYRVLRQPEDAGH
ncbi:MAG TPA: CocE/NonD family hydrolase [Bacteroidota bacterium]|nr:CocE/NonD family hydrolase [Bacteroidota bacterium]